MKRRVLPNVCLFVAFLTTLVPAGSLTSMAQGQSTQTVAAPNTSDQAPAEEIQKNSSLMFIENLGQFDEGARFQVWAGDRTVWLAEDGLWITVTQRSVESDSKEGAGGLEGRLPHMEIPERQAREEVHLKLSFPGANPDARLEPFDRLDTRVSYFLGGDPAGWHSDVPVWGGVRYVDIYPSIDLEIGGGDGWSWRMVAKAPQADLEAVRLRVDGVKQAKLEGNGLRLTTALGDLTLSLLTMGGCAHDLRQTVPRVGKVPTDGDLPAAFSVASPFAQSSTSSMSASTRDSPEDLLYSTYLGGGDDDGAFGVAVDQAGNAHVVGTTFSAGFPTSIGAVGPSLGGSQDVFVAKLNADGSGLLYSTFLGGADFERSGREIGIDEAGAVFITGSTGSEDFPTTPGAYDRLFNGGTDTFISKVGAEGTELLYSTLVGGQWGDVPYSIAVDNVGSAFVTGTTGSDDFPTTPGAVGGVLQGDQDAFVIRLSADGSDLVYATYLGGLYFDHGFGITPDGEGYAYVTGAATEGFPTTAGAYDTSFNEGLYDVFVVKLNPAGTDLVYGTFLGGDSGDSGRAIDFDEAGNAFVLGWTASGTFPITAGAFDPDFGGSTDVFLVKLNSDGSDLDYGTYVGGSDDEYAYSLAAEGDGTVIATGYTLSSDFPSTENSYDTSYNGGWDGFLLRMNASGTELDYATFLGGSDNEPNSGAQGSFGGPSAAMDLQGDVYLAGSTASSDFPTTIGAYDTSPNGGSDAFVVKLRARKPKLKLLFVPLRWQSTQEAFNAEVDVQVGFFLSDVPLGMCRDRVMAKKLDVKKQGFDGFTCTYPNDCAVSTIRPFVRDELEIEPADYDIIVGLAETSPCPDFAGCSNGTDTTWVVPVDESVTAHEIGHIYGLEDEYCSNQAGSTDSRCNDGDSQEDGAETGDLNWLDPGTAFDCPPDGSLDSSGFPCCSFDSAHDCSSVNYGVCCYGNKNSAGGRATMSYADAQGPRGYDAHSLAHLHGIPELSCDPVASLRAIDGPGFYATAFDSVVDVNLLIYQDDSVVDESVSITQGRPTSTSVLEYQTGEYALEVSDQTGKAVWHHTFGVFFGYDGPVLLGVDYSGVSYDAVDVSYRVPYDFRMHTINLYHGEDLLFSKQLPATDVHRIYLPVTLRDY